MNPDIYCRDRAAPPGSSLYYATLFLPPQPRALFTATEAMRLELLDVVHRTGDWSVANQRLAWWSNEIVAARDAAPTHPATRALTALAGAALWRDPSWVSALGALGRLARAGGFPEAADRDAFCRALGACLGPGLAERDDGPEPERLLDIGYWLQRSELTRVPVAPAPAGLHYLPASAFGDPGGFEPWPRRGHTPEPVSRWLGDQLAECMAALERLQAGCARSQSPLVAALRVRLLIERATLARCARAPDRLPREQLAITPLRKLWIAWRAFR